MKITNTSEMYGHTSLDINDSPKEVEVKRAQLELNTLETLYTSLTEDMRTKAEMRIVQLLAIDGVE